MMSSAGISSTSARARGVLGQPSAAAYVLEQVVGIDAGRRRDRTVHIGHADEDDADGHREAGRPRPDVAEALDDDARIRRAHAEVQDRLAQRRDDAAARGRLAPGRAPEGDRLAGDDRRVVAGELAVLVHHPGHDLGVRVHVRGRDVAVGADELADAIDELARDVLQLVQREPVTGAVDPALGAAEGDVDDGRLPAHQRGERPNLVEIDGLVVAHAALVRAAGGVVLHAVAAEHMDAAVAQPDRDLDRDLAVGRREDRADVVVESEVVCGDVEVVVDRLQGGEVRGGGARRFTRHGVRRVTRLGRPGAGDRDGGRRGALCGS